MSSPVDVTFRSGSGEHAADCRAWFLPAAGAEPGSERPCVVMAHGLGGTADSGLMPFAEAFAAAGYAALAFDYRGFGRSGGRPRQVVSPERQQEDYRAAIAAAAAQPGVDPARIVLWGCSLAGGHVLEVARGRADIAAVISMVPLVDGRAAAVAAARQHRPASLLRSTGTAIAARAVTALGRAEPMVPLTGPPGSTALLSLDGYEQAYTSVAGPTWRNEVGASIGTELGSFRPGRHADDLAGVPLLVQIADLDRSAPPHAAATAAFSARAEVRHYPGDHFDLFAGRPCHDRAVAHAVHFLRRHVG
ncbi:alpha/beta hydrolase [Dietzia sp. UBA5065]|mgnify:FL=1|jgi:alpha-beta hydrolase superfamily lysophospholipase|uniref:alpha/beta hydrolase n=1 Tax=Dietzia sp. UBA5065 TaxID=1946422 RepID=UPI0025BC5385|nr:alpha/beta fold hydrolase [Dietzia sp. UBA5065]HMT48646.1 alpha/beta fold hydrolase [Dietzia sp.]